MRILGRVCKIGEIPKIGWNHGYVFGYLWISVDMYGCFVCTLKFDLVNRHLDPECFFFCFVGHGMLKSD